MSESTIRPNRVRLAVFFSPKEGLSADECRNYWLNTHAKIFTSTAVVKRNLLKYEQFHVDPGFTPIAAAMIPGYTPPTYFGVAIFEAESLQKIIEVFQDEEVRRVVTPDEENFMSRKDMQLVAGPVFTVYGS